MPYWPARVQAHTRSQHRELLVDRWLKRESAFSGGFGLKAPRAYTWQTVDVCIGYAWTCVDVHLFAYKCALCDARSIRTCNSAAHAFKNSCVQMPLHVRVSSDVYRAQNQQNATGMRISVALPWKQRNARGDWSCRIKAQRSSQQEERNEGPDLTSLLLEPPPLPPLPPLVSSSISVWCELLQSETNSHEFM